jgi:hypothetical protein
MAYSLDTAGTTAVVGDRGLGLDPSSTLGTTRSGDGDGDSMVVCQVDCARTGCWSGWTVGESD